MLNPILNRAKRGLSAPAEFLVVSVNLQVVVLQVALSGQNKHLL